MPAETVEQARALLLDLHPEGFEEAEGELVVYTDAEGVKKADSSLIRD